MRKKKYYHEKCNNKNLKIEHALRNGGKVDLGSCKV